MVPRLLRGLVVVSLLGILVGMALVYRAVATWEGPLAEGPYRKERPGRCVCK